MTTTAPVATSLAAATAFATATVMATQTGGGCSVEGGVKTMDLRGRPGRRGQPALPPASELDTPFGI